ncbi:maestro heat-like repeat-containing protein family member 7 [Agelaius tricolor]|uniref:maestro heat-like repeat-containing protein family member 7 n=1 Tax=Agelaius tricolor TaxID=9191 RepID=UPI0039F20A9C
MTMKALLCELQYEDVVSEVERECGWDTLLNTDTHHHTVGLLARAMLRISQSLCYRIARYLFRLLRGEEARWEVAAMAFLVEILPCLNIKQWGERILQLFPNYLWRECRVMRLLVLRCLMVLCKRPSMVPTIVRDIYQWLAFITDVSAEHRLDKTLQEMTLAQPLDVVVTLLRCAPSCDRYEARWHEGIRIHQLESS